MGYLSSFTFVTATLLVVLVCAALTGVSDAAAAAPACGIEHCLTCDAQGACVVCEPGYEGIGPACGLVPASPYTKEQCAAMFTCQPEDIVAVIVGRCYCCIQGTKQCIPSEGHCADPTHCTACDAGNGECTECQPGYSVAGGLCKAVCAAPHCSVCVENSATDCKTCEDGYIQVGTTCEEIPCEVDGCKECTLGSSTVCAFCKPGYYYLTDVGICARVCGLLRHVRGWLIACVPDVRAGLHAVRRRMCAVTRTLRPHSFISFTK